MKEQGIIIFEDGTTSTFGTYYSPDHPRYHNTPGHEESFLAEIEPSFEFKLSNLEYNHDLSFMLYYFH